jgi:DNA-binding transcriptional MerR regulator
VDKAPDAFRTISEVADELNVPQHVLRFWETRFAQIKPMKRGGGRRYYRPDDLDLLRGIRHLLYGEGYTIRGVQRILKDNGIRFVQSVWQSGAPQPEPAHLVDGDADDSETVNGADGVDEAESIVPSAARTPIAPQRRAGLSPDDLQSLRAALAELAECRRLLDAAMKDEA